MSKIAAVVLAVGCMVLCSLPLSAQLIPHGNVYVGVAYGNSDIVTANRKDLKGWNASGEAIIFPHLGVVADVSGFYRTDVRQYNILFGPRLSASVGKFRPFVHGLFGVQKVNLSGTSYQPIAYDFGGGVDYKFLRIFAWRLQADYVHTHYLSASQDDIRGSTGLVFRF